MDQRRQELKALKKACLRRKRKLLGLSRCLCLVFFVLTAAVTPLALSIPLYPACVDALLERLGITDSRWFGIALVFYAAVTLVMAILWGLGRGRYQKSREYLDHRTLRTTLQAEKRGNRR